MTHADTMPISVALVDDHEVVHDGLMTWCAAAVPPIQVAASCTEPDDFVARFPSSTDSGIDVVVLDLQFGEGNPVASIDAVRALSDAGHRVIVFSMRTDHVTILDCLDAGAVTYLAKIEGRAHMVSAIQAAVTDTPYIGPRMAGAMTEDARSSRPSLSDREKDVLRQWFRTESKVLTGKALYIAIGTVNTHLARVRTKYAAAGRSAPTKAALVARAIQDNIISLDEL